MNQLKLNLLGVAFLALFLAACNPGGKGSVVIDSPAANAEYFSQLPTFKLSYGTKPADPSKVKVVLNGFNVQSYFTFGDTSATANAEDLKDFMVQGTNTIVINPTLFKPKRKFVFDNQGPHIVVTEVSKSNPIEVTGFAKDPSGIKSLTLNGNNATITSDPKGNHTFSVTVDSADIYNFQASDNLNQASSLSYAAPGKVFNDSIKASVGASALNAIAPKISSVLVDTGFNEEQLNPVNPLLGGALSWKGGITGNTYGMRINLSSLKVGAVGINDLSVRPNNDGSLGFDVDVKNADVTVTVIIYGGGKDNLDFSLALNIGNINAKGVATLAAKDQALDINVSGDDLKLNMTNTALVVGSSVPGETKNYEPPFDILSKIINALSAPVGKLAAGKINAILANQLEFVIKTRLFIQDVGLGLTTSMESIGTKDGNIVVALGGKVEPLTTIKPGNNRPVLGSIYNDAPTPDPRTDLGNLTAVVSGNFLNQAVMAAFKAGLIDITVFGNQILLGAIVDNTMGVNGNTRIRVAPSAPPGFSFAGEKVAVANVSMYNLDILQEKKINGEWKPIVKITVDFRAAVVLGVTNDNAIKISLLNYPDVELQALDNGFGFNVSTSVVNSIIDKAVPIVIDKIADAIPAIKIPAIAGIALKPEEIATVGTKNDTLSFTGTIELAK